MANVFAWPVWIDGPPRWVFFALICYGVWANRSWHAGIWKRHGETQAAAAKSALYSRATADTADRNESKIDGVAQSVGRVAHTQAVVAENLAATAGNTPAHAMPAVGVVTLPAELTITTRAITPGD